MQSSLAPAQDSLSEKNAALPHSLFTVTSDMDLATFEYLFALNGYCVLKNAISSEKLEQINQWIDDHPADNLEPGEWIGDVETHTYGSKDGINYQNILEGGPAFESLIDNPAWIDRVKHFIVNNQHQLRIDECFINIRKSGGFIPIHSGGTTPRFSSVFQFMEGQWMVGQINILMALKDVGPGDGATTVVPGSHLSLRDHPTYHTGSAWEKGINGSDAVGMIETSMKAGDALMFTDAICHGSMPRTNPGERRVMIYRYAPQLMASRHQYLPTEELLDRLTPEQRQIVQPVTPRMRPGRTLIGKKMGNSEQ